MKIEKILDDHVKWLRGLGGEKAELSRANLSDADLSGADLSGANISGADLSDADLSGANLSGRIPLYADTSRRYVLYVLPDVEDGPRFIAGCRNFALEEALEHWGAESDRSQPEYIAAIEKYLAQTTGEQST